MTGQPNTTMERCDDCYAQVDTQDRYQHRHWHQDQDEVMRGLDEEAREGDEDLRSAQVDIIGLERSVEALRGALEQTLAELARLSPVSPERSDS